MRTGSLYLRERGTERQTDRQTDGQGEGSPADSKDRYGFQASAAGWGATAITSKVAL